MLWSTTRPRTWPVLSSKPARVLATLLLSFIAALCLVNYYRSTPWSKEETDATVLDIAEQESTAASSPVHEGRKGRLHLLVPATSTNPDLCKLLLSAQILGYPTPVLINYGDREEADGYKQHLGKVEGILNYLTQIQHNDEFAEDLVLIIDGFDVWFQLRPDVLIKRYYAINAAADARAVERYGQELVDTHDIRQTVVFGSDKICWPVDFSRPACWAVPQGPWPEDTFGPKSTVTAERDKNVPRWLNSGTVMGPAEDLVDIFRATLEQITTRYNGDSDQYYLANNYGDQEYTRIQRVPGLVEKVKNKSMEMLDWEDGSKGFRFEPALYGRERTEYHIGLDYSSSMFQSLAFWRQHLSWTKLTTPWTPSDPSPYPSSIPHTYSLPADIAASPPPYDALSDLLEPSSDPPTWSDVLLAYNTITREIPVLLHVTGNPREKGFRLFWWHKIWFQPHAEQLRSASMAPAMSDQKRISNETIAGMWWEVAEGSEVDTEGLKQGGKGGVWTDRRGWLSWKRMCGNDEEGIFAEGSDWWFHAEGGRPGGEPQPPAEAEPEAEDQQQQQQQGQEVEGGLVGLVGEGQSPPLDPALAERPPSELSSTPLGGGGDSNVAEPNDEWKLQDPVPPPPPGLPPGPPPALAPPDVGDSGIPAGGLSPPPAVNDLHNEAKVLPMPADMVAAGLAQPQPDTQESDGGQVGQPVQAVEVWGDDGRGRVHRPDSVPEQQAQPAAVAAPPPPPPPHPPADAGSLQQDSQLEEGMVRPLPPPTPLPG